jgi:two-component system chemotaxis response regulator CheY
MKIMIVDDSETLRTQLRKDLEAGGFQIVEGFDGVHGLETLEANKDVKLIICDVNMPRMDGLSMCQKVNSNPEYKAIPLLMMTTESSPEMKAQGKAAGVVAWVTKPYVAEKLVTVVKKIVQK